MAAITNATDIASLPEFINSEVIEKKRIKAAMDKVAFELVAEMVDLTGLDTNTIAKGQWTEVSVAGGTHTETDEIAAVEQTATEVTIGVDSVGIRAAVSTEVIDSITNLMADVMVNQLRAMKKRQDTDWHTNVTSATNSGDYSGLPMDLDVFGDELAAFMAQNPPSEDDGAVYFSGDPDQISRDFMKAIESAGASVFASGSMNDAISGLLGAGKRVIKGVYRDVIIMAAGATAAFDGSNWAGHFGIANEGTIAHTFKRKTNVVDGSLQRYAHAVMGDVTRDHFDVVLTTRYGDGIITNDNLREVATMT